MSSDSPQRGAETVSYIALGSNLGDRAATLRSAISALQQLGSVDATSSFYETAPVGMTDQPDFLNAVAALRTTQPPLALMTELLRIEQQHGRDRSASVPKGPRTLDLDLLSYGAVVMETPALTLPHPALSERRFVLQPLTEIAPQWHHPITEKTAATLLSELSQRAEESSQPFRTLNSTPSA